MPAPTFTNLTANGGSSATSFTTASITPTGDRLVIVTVHAYISTGSTAPSEPTVTGNGITWGSPLHTQDVDTAGTDRATMFVYVGMATSPSSGAITIDFGATTMTRCIWVVDQSDANVITSGARDTVIQHVGSTFASVSSASQSYTQIEPGTSTMYAAFAHQTNVATTPRTSWTEIADTTPVSLASLETQYYTGSDTAASATWGTAARSGVTVLEVASTGPVVADVQETAWTTTTTPKTVTFAGAQTGDRILILACGDASIGFGSNEVTACTTSTTAGSTGSWTEPAEGLSSGDFDWISSATTTVSSTGSVTVSVDRTKNGTTGGSWGFYGLLLRGDGGIGNIAGVTAAGSSQTVSLTTSQDSLVAFISADWDAASFATGLTPAGGIDVERSSGADFTVCAGYWRGQSAATTSYGGSGGGASSKYRCLAIEVLTAGSGSSGTSSTTQADQTSSASGQLGYSGTLGTTSANQTSSASGATINPITGTAAVTQDAHNSTASGQLGYSGSLSITQAPNSPSAAGKLGYSGSVAATQANQAASAAGQLGYTGTSATTETADTSSASGTFTGVGFSGNAAITQAANTVTASGQLGYSGTAAASQASQTPTASGQLGYSGTSAGTQAAQTATASGQLGYSGTLTATQQNNTSSASGAYTPAGTISGTAAVTQAAQTATASGALGYSGTLSRTQANQTPTASGTVINPVTGTAAVIQGNQTPNAAGKLGYSGTSAVTETADVLVAVGASSGPAAGSAAVTQANQTASIAGYFAPLVSFGTATGAVAPVPTAVAATAAVAKASAAVMNVPTASGG